MVLLRLSKSPLGEVERRTVSQVPDMAGGARSATRVPQSTPAEALAGRLRPGGASRERFERGETGLRSLLQEHWGVGTRVASYIVKL